LHQSIQDHWQEDVLGTSHQIDIKPNSRVSQLFQAGTQINSLHRQSIKELATDLVATAHDPRDGTIEAYESKGQHAILGIQWHPEFLAKNCSSNQRLFDYLVKNL
ncbi:gamma-glutamyl-gamma-aminobutyrate hydrolase family protein, partial [Streptococcus pyogenes]